jgi:3-oxoacyl-[acyl-carrier protein] reductase
LKSAHLKINLFPHLYGAYAATKGAVEQITKVLAKELGPRAIGVNTWSPGPVDTELFRAGKTDEQIRQLAGLAALGRIGTPEGICRYGWSAG